MTKKNKRRNKDHELRRGKKKKKKKSEKVPRMIPTTRIVSVNYYDILHVYG